MRNGWGHLACSAWRRLMRDPIVTHNFLVRGSEGAGTDLSSLVTNDRTWANDLKLRGGLCWIGKGSAPSRWLDSGAGFPGKWSQHQPDRVQGVFGQCYQALSETLGGGPVQCQELDFNDLCGSLAAQDIWWFYDSLLQASQRRVSTSVGKSKQLACHRRSN